MDPDQLASSEASLLGSAVFKKALKFFCRQCNYKVEYGYDLFMIFFLQKIQAEMEIQDFPEIGKATVNVIKGVCALRGYFSPTMRPKNENRISQVSSY